LTTNCGASLRGVGFFPLNLWDQSLKLIPAILEIKCAAEQQMELLDCALAVIVPSVHLRESGVTATIDCLFRVRFSASSFPRDQSQYIEFEFFLIPYLIVAKWDELIILCFVLVA
jgi:hypothetical protein